MAVDRRTVAIEGMSWNTGVRFLRPLEKTSSFCGAFNCAVCSAATSASGLAGGNAKGLGDGITVEALASEEDGVEIGVQWPGVLAPAIEAMGDAGHRPMDRLATGAVNPRSVEQERQFAAAQTFEAAVRVLREQGE